MENTGFYGSWVPGETLSGHSHHWNCSLCGSLIFTYRRSYCPKCGASMAERPDARLELLNKDYLTATSLSTLSFDLLARVRDYYEREIAAEEVRTGWELHGE